MEVVHPALRWKVVAAMLTTVLRSDRMDLHQNAKTTPNGRLLMVQRLVEGWSVARVAAAFGVTTRTVRKWQARHAREGGLPPEKWSSLRYGFEPSGGRENGEEATYGGGDCRQTAAG
jgi:transposase-like protein